MCVAIFKPKNVQVPDRNTLNRCFDKNPDGAGFAIYRNNKIEIHKGFMDFNSFYFNFLKSNPKKDENILIHFRIATHGLVDSGNTHPFPLTDDFEFMRKKDLYFNGKVLVHNGVFHYPTDVVDKYDKFHKYSDTMLFTKFLFDSINYMPYLKTYDTSKFDLQELIAYAIVKDNYNDETKQKVLQKISYSKVAVMDENGNVFKFGNWIEHNGCFYSNHSFEAYKPISYYNSQCNLVPFASTPKSINDLVICDFCGQYKTKCVETDGQNICPQCLKDYNIQYCCCCKKIYDKTDMYSKGLCKSCFDYIQNLSNKEEDNNYNEYNNEYSDDVDYDSYYDQDQDYDYGYDQDQEQDGNKYAGICLCCGQNMKYNEISLQDHQICQACYDKYKSGE